MHGVKPVAAMKASFMACIRNFVPFLVYGIVMLAARIRWPVIIPSGWIFTACWCSS